MKLNERIKKCRLEASLSQEKVAELVGVSRQAVTKWESGLSAPSTENLFRLAEIFGTSVDMLMPNTETNDSDVKDTPPLSFNSYEELYAVFAKIKKAEREEKKRRIRSNILYSLAVLAFYVAFFYICRFIWGDISRNSLVSFLFLDDSPSGEHSYLYGWLLSSYMYYYAAALSVTPAIFGSRLYPLVTAVGFTLGFILGVFFGPYPAGIPYGHDHYGWAIWLIAFILSVILGIIAEIIKKHLSKRTSRP